MFVCELSWTWYGGARVVEVFGLGWASVVFACFFHVLEGGGFGVFAKVIVVGDLCDLLRILGLTC